MHLIWYRPKQHHIMYVLGKYQYSSTVFIFFFKLRQLELSNGVKCQNVEHMNSRNVTSCNLQQVFGMHLESLPYMFSKAKRSGQHSLSECGANYWQSNALAFFIFLFEESIYLLLPHGSLNKSKSHQWYASYTLRKLWTQYLRLRLCISKGPREDNGKLTLLAYFTKTILDDLCMLNVFNCLRWSCKHACIFVENFTVASLLILVHTLPYKVFLRLVFIICCNFHILGRFPELT